MKWQTLRATSRQDRTDRQGELEGKTTEEVLSLPYPQGVAEALDAFSEADLYSYIARRLIRLREMDTHEKLIKRHNLLQGRLEGL